MCQKMDNPSTGIFPTKVVAFRETRMLHRLLYDKKQQS